MILHIDMDAFYASVEQLDAPDLRGKCVIVGGHSRRGVVTAASYEARKFGVHAAMPMFQAKQKCPQAVVVPGRMARYREISKEIMGLLQGFSPAVEPISIDEAYVDIAGFERLYGTPEQIGLNIKTKIRRTVHLSCSVGIAPTKFLAKIASDMDKPDGLTVIHGDDALPFIQSLPIRKVPGVGKVAHEQLDLLGIKTLGDLAALPERTLKAKLGKFGYRLRDLSRNIDPSVVSPSSTVKSISTETTLPENTENKDELRAYLLRQSESVGHQLRIAKVRAKTVTLKIKHADFKRATRSAGLDRPTQSSKAIYKTANRLLQAYSVTKPIRLIGLGATGLLEEDTPEQMPLFGDRQKPDKNWERVDAAVDAIAHKYGKNIINKASLQDP
jgi:DNA polymerase IV